MFKKDSISMASSWTIKQLFNVADMHNIGTFVFTCLLLYVGIECMGIGTKYVF